MFVFVATTVAAFLTEQIPVLFAETSSVVSLAQLLWGCFPKDEEAPFEELTCICFLHKETWKDNKVLPLSASQGTKARWELSLSLVLRVYCASAARRFTEAAFIHSCFPFPG